MRFLKAIGGIFATLLAILTGGLLDFRKKLMSTPSGIRAEYDAVISEKTNRAKAIRDAVKGLIANKAKKEERAKAYNEEITKLTKLKAGAAAQAKKALEAAGGDQSNASFLKHKSAFTDFDSTLQEKIAHRDETLADLESDEKAIGKYERQIKSVLRELDKIKNEKHETVAEVTAAKEAQAIADELNGLTEDTTGEKLNTLREIRREAKAGQQVSERLAGLDTKADEEEYLSASVATEANDEFDQLMGIAASTESGAKAGASHDKATSELPE